MNKQRPASPKITVSVVSKPRRNKNLKDLTTSYESATIVAKMPSYQGTKMQSIVSLGAAGRKEIQKVDFMPRVKKIDNSEPPGQSDSDSLEEGKNDAITISVIHKKKIGQQSQVVDARNIKNFQSLHALQAKADLPPQGLGGSPGKSSKSPVSSINYEEAHPIKSKSMVVLHSESNSVNVLRSISDNRREPKNFDLVRNDISKQDFRVNPEETRSYHDERARQDRVARFDLRPRRQAQTNLGISKGINHRTVSHEGAKRNPAARSTVSVGMAASTFSNAVEEIKSRSVRSNTMRTQRSRFSYKSKHSAQDVKKAQEYIYKNFGFDINEIEDVGENKSGIEVKTKSNDSIRLNNSITDAANMNEFTDAHLLTRNERMKLSEARSRAKSNRDLPTLIEGDESSLIAEAKKSLNFDLAPSTGRNEGQSAKKEASKTGGESLAFKELFEEQKEEEKDIAIQQQPQPNSNHFISSFGLGKGPRSSKSSGNFKQFSQEDPASPGRDPTDSQPEVEEEVPEDRNRQKSASPLPKVQIIKPKASKKKSEYRKSNYVKESQMIRKKIARQISNPRGASKKAEDPFSSLFTSSSLQQPWKEEEGVQKMKNRNKVMQMRKFPAIPRKQAIQPNQIVISLKKGQVKKSPLRGGNTSRRMDRAHSAQAVELKVINPKSLPTSYFTGGIPSPTKAKPITQLARAHSAMMLPQNDLVHKHHVRSRSRGGRSKGFLEHIPESDVMPPSAGKQARQKKQQPVFPPLKKLQEPHDGTGTFGIINGHNFGRFGVTERVGSPTDPQASLPSGRKMKAKLPPAGGAKAIAKYGKPVKTYASTSKPATGGAKLAGSASKQTMRPAAKGVNASMSKKKVAAKAYPPQAKTKLRKTELNEEFREPVRVHHEVPDPRELSSPLEEEMTIQVDEEAFSDEGNTFNPQNQDHSRQKSQNNLLFRQQQLSQQLTQQTQQSQKKEEKTYQPRYFDSEEQPNST